jgi:hypothetical protein
MTKVVYNSCYGGFSLSREACERYWELQGKKVWIENGNFMGIFTVWLVPPEERITLVEAKNWSSMSLTERLAYNKKHSEQTWYDHNVDRHDPILVQVVEELGEEADGDCAKLAIAEVSGPYRIDEYDGSESVKQPDGYDWITP